jgi:hypothetical protein
MRTIRKQQKGYFIYIWGTIQFGIHYSLGGTPLLVGFTNLLCFQSWFGPITWACKKQCALALSLAEVEYRAKVSASQEALWLQTNPFRVWILVATSNHTLV